MQARSLILIAYFLAGGGGHAMAAQRIGELEVREGNGGVPCFTIPESEERRSGAPEFESISVLDAGRGRTPMWRMAMTRPHTFAVSYRMCIPYAGRLPVLPQVPAASLQPGHPYEATIEVRASAAASAPRYYRARFCLVPQERGIPRVRMISAGGASPRSRAMCAISPSRP